ncbi:MAG: hypothetical protein II826_03045 [Prevotella sp.]|nr:hypothetical protein [Prevotella sp.]
MLQKEFEERIGRSVTQEEYVEANAMYMAAGDNMDKDVFCREWKQIGESPLVKGLFETAYNLNQALQEQKLMLGECQEMLSDAADAMLEICNGLLDGETVEHTTQELTKKAWWLVGQKEVTKRRFQNGYQLDDKDRETIINNLTK